VTPAAARTRSSSCRRCSGRRIQQQQQQQPELTLFIQAVGAVVVNKSSTTQDRCSHVNVQIRKVKGLAFRSVQQLRDTVERDISVGERERERERGKEPGG
jgi:hypothetical protein